METTNRMTDRAKKVIELSLREALALGHNYIGTEHILLGLIREGEGTGAQVLRELGLAENEVRAVVIAHLSRPAPPPSIAQRLGDAEREIARCWARMNAHFGEGS